jgi:hypothetical protein
MSYGLKFDGQNDYTTADPWNPTALGFSFGVEFIAGDLTQNILDGTYNKGIYIRVASNTLYMWYNGSPMYAGAPSKVFVSGTTYKLEGFVYANGSAAIFIDDVEVASVTSGMSLGSASTALTIGKTTFAPNNYSDFTVLSAWVTDDTTPSNSRYYDPTASSHAAGATALVDTIGGKDSTGVNMPTDGSAWVNLGGGASNLTIDISEQLPLIADSVTSDVSANITLSISEQLPSAIDSVTGYIDTSNTGTIFELMPSATDSMSATINVSNSINASVIEAMPTLSDTLSLSIESNFNASIVESMPSAFDIFSANIKATITADINESLPMMIDDIIAYTPIKITINTKRLARVRNAIKTTRIRSKTTTTFKVR